MGKPILVDTFVVNKSVLEGIPTWAAIDRGCSLTKILYVSKKEATMDHVTLTCFTYKNTDFEAGIDDMKANAFLPKTGELCVTGVGCDKYREIIKEKIGLNIRFVEELYTMMNGPHFLVKNFTTEEISFPLSEEDKKPRFAPLDGVMRNLTECITAPIKDVDPESKFPVIVLNLGSAAGITLLHENGKSEMIGGTLLSGKTLLGLGHLLLGTSDYEEIMKLAEKGDEKETSLLVKNNHLNIENSPYGKMDGNMPLVPFGNIKPGDRLANKKREDLAIGLVNFLCSHLTSMSLQAATSQKCVRVYIGGNVARSALFRTKMREQNEIMAMNRLQFIFLKTGHTGAIGAMLTKAGEDEV